MKNFLRYVVFFVSSLLISQKIEADPPFLTNKADPTPYQHSIFYLFSTFNKIDAPANVKYVQGPVVEGRWGAHPRFDVFLIMPMNTYIPRFPQPGDSRSSGLGDVEIGSRILLFSYPQEGIKVSFTPDLILPTGNARQFLGNGKMFGRLPLWAQKTWGDWIFDMGGGYGINHAQNKFNFYYGGGKIKYNVTKELLLGVECFYRDRTNVVVGRMLILNAGGQYYFTQRLGALLSAGHTVSGTKNLLAFLGLRWDW